MNKRIDHTHCSHTATPRARKSCRDARNTALNAARHAYLEFDDDYIDLVHALALVFNIDIPDAYELVEEGAL